MTDVLYLKWGTVKGWSLESDEAFEALNKWAAFGHSISAAAQKDTPEQKQALIDAIDFMDKIFLEWEGRWVTREEAKEYVRNYGDEE